MSQVIQDIRITSATTLTVIVSFATANTSSLAMTAYPVFSASTTDGTTFFRAGTPLRILSPTTATIAASTPSVATNTAAGVATATLAFGTSFNAAGNEWESGGTPRQYRYILHVSAHTPATSYSSAITASTAVSMSGSISLAIPAASPQPAVKLLSVLVR